PPGATLIRRVRNTVSDAGARIYDEEITIGPDGAFHSGFDSSAALPGNYLVQVASRQAGVETPLAGAPYTVTDGLTPGVPHTGAGGGDRQCFPETSQCVEGRFLAYWRANGGLAVFGYPLTGE